MANELKPRLNSSTENKPKINTPVNLTKNNIPRPAGLVNNNLTNKPQNNILKQETKTIVGEDDKPKTKKRSKVKIILKVFIFIIATAIFLSACTATIYAVMSIINKKNGEIVKVGIEINISDGMQYRLKERVINDENEVSLKDVNSRDLEFKWVNDVKKSYELKITFDTQKAFRFRHYNLYDSSYTAEELFSVDFVSNTSNFDTKFILADDGYYYFIKNSQPSNQITFIIDIDFSIPDYRNQFDGSIINEIFKYEQSANPKEEWGYYSYIFSD